MLVLVTAGVCLAIGLYLARGGGAPWSSATLLGNAFKHALDDIERRVDRIMRARRERNGAPPKYPAVKLSGPYALWREQHNTTSYAIDYTLERARSTATLLRAVFWQHMRSPEGPGLACMCMHHLHVDRLLRARDRPLIMYRLCGVYNAQQEQLYMMANPKMSGGSKEPRVELREHSVSCPENYWRTVRRNEVLFLDWVDPFTQRAQYRRFGGPESYCMQLALEEMAPGKAHCANGTDEGQLVGEI